MKEKNIFEYIILLYELIVCGLIIWVIPFFSVGVILLILSVFIYYSKINISFLQFLKIKISKILWLERIKNYIFIFFLKYKLTTAYSFLKRYIQNIVKKLVNVLPFFIFWFGILLLGYSYGRFLSDYTIQDSFFSVSDRDLFMFFYVIFSLVIIPFYSFFISKINYFIENYSKKGYKLFVLFMFFGLILLFDYLTVGKYLDLGHKISNNTTLGYDRGNIEYCGLPTHHDKEYICIVDSLFKYISYNIGDNVEQKLNELICKRLKNRYFFGWQTCEQKIYHALIEYLNGECLHLIYKYNKIGIKGTNLETKIINNINYKCETYFYNQEHIDKCKSASYIHDRCYAKLKNY